jgi:hypothetical protein
MHTLQGIRRIKNHVSRHLKGGLNYCLPSEWHHETILQISTPRIQRSVSSLEEFLRGFATFGMIVHVIEYIIHNT